MTKKILFLLIALLLISACGNRGDTAKVEAILFGTGDGIRNSTGDTSSSSSGSTPLPTTGTISLPKTGQTTSFAVGDDGDLEMGVAWPPTRFTVGTGAEAECVTDNLTGLMWVKSPEGTTRTWQQALDYANGLTFCGYTDWRLPNRKELRSLVDYSKSDPALPAGHPFLNVKDIYGSSSSPAGTDQWYVDMWDGSVSVVNKADYFDYWPVRSGQSGSIDLPETGQTTCYDSAGSVISCTGTGQDGELQTGVAWPDPRFTVGTGAEAECVTDNLTGLTWTKNANLPNDAMTWQQALDYANNLTLCGYSDWRLPNVTELESLVNAGQSNTVTWLNGQGFSNVQSDYYYWSSSTYASGTDGAWYVHMWGVVRWYGSKASGGGYETDGRCVWPVRAGQ